MFYRPTIAPDPGTIASVLLDEVRKNRADSWNRMVQLYAPLVYHWCRREGLQACDAEDIVQEVFRTVAARVGEFVRTRENGSFRGWLRTITRYKTGNHLKEIRRREVCRLGLVPEECCCRSSAATWRGQQEDEECSTENRLLYWQVLNLIRSEFEERTWLAFWRLMADEVPARQVADELEMSTNAVYLAKSRVLRRVRDELRTHAKVPHPR